MASSEGEGRTGPGEEMQNDGRGHTVIYNDNRQVNNFGSVANAILGHNYGTAVQTAGASATPSGSSSGVLEPKSQRQELTIERPLILSGSQYDIVALLNPILDASYTRNREVSPPNSACFPGTRESVIEEVLTWVKSSLTSRHDRPSSHIMWIYGFAGCGKSAIAQAVAQHFAEKGQLAASFFFFRGAGDRSNVLRFATTIASQIASTISGTAPRIKAAVKKNRGLLSTATATLTAQFQHLIYDPINDALWGKIYASLRGRPYLIVLDGLDECEDRREVAAFIEHMIEFFAKKPRTPLRFLITSRVESHIYQRLHSCDQVRLLDLVDHTSDSDIAAALDAALEKEKGNRILDCDRSWPSAEDKAKLVKHIGGSYIFMTTILRLLFDPILNDGLTPMERLPHILSTDPDFDSLYRSILGPWQHLLHFRDIISTIALAMEPLSVSQIADLNGIGTANVVNVLVNLHSIFQIPGDDNTPVTVWHTSLRDFLCAEDRSGSISASATHHRRLAYRCISVVAASESVNEAVSPSLKYSRNYAIEHLAKVAEITEESPELLACELRDVMNVLQMPVYKDSQTALEVACRERYWKLVCALIDAGANVNTRFTEHRNGIVCALHAACNSEKLEIVYLLLERGADPNIVSHNEDKSGFNDGTPLAFAALEGDVKLATRLLECGADPNLQGGYWGTALRAACWSNSLEVVNLLLGHGADPNLRGGRYDRSPLRTCADYGRDGCARALLMCKANPNIQDNKGRIPLHNACRYGRVKMVECLLEFKADASIRNEGGQTALQVAVNDYASWLPERNRDGVIQVLRQHGIVE